MTDIDFVREQLESGYERANAEAAQQAARDQAWEAEYRAREKQVKTFLSNCGATSCPIELYTIWLIAWIQRGGQIARHNKHSFSRYDFLTATKSTDLPIPEAYGAASFKMLIWDERASITDAPSTDDPRRGWEYGHSTVLRLTTGEAGLIAGTNKPDSVESFKDVKDLIARSDMLELQQRLRRL